MANLNRIVYLTEAQKNTLFTSGSVTSGLTTITYNDNDLYITPQEFDATVTQNSNNLITSGAVYTALNNSGFVTSSGVTSITPGNGLLNGSTTNAITTTGTLNLNYGTSASAIGTASAGSANTVSRSDHVHNISLATGDANGLIKIAGSNVNVKGFSGLSTTTAAIARYADATGGLADSSAIIDNSGNIKLTNLAGTIYKLYRSGGWALNAIQMVNSSGTVQGRIGAYGNNESPELMYLGFDTYSSDNVLKIGTSGLITATNLLTLKLRAPTSAGGTTYSYGSSGLVLLSNGSSSYWGDTIKNTAGSTNSTSKTYLIGALEQSANPQTYSHTAVYATAGEMAATSYKVAETVTLVYSTTSQALNFVFA